MIGLLSESLQFEHQPNLFKSPTRGLMAEFGTWCNKVWYLMSTHVLSVMQLLLLQITNNKALNDYRILYNMLCCLNFHLSRCAWLYKQGVRKLRFYYVFWCLVFICSTIIIIFKFLVDFRICTYIYICICRLWRDLHNLQSSFFWHPIYYE